ncbi:MAG: internalin [Flavobacterium sp. BFFFF2]|nr:MAG: internalin [Flavobacterium sp. BFFFF2]
MKTQCTIILIFLTVICHGQIVNIPNANFKAKLITLGKDLNADGQIQLTEALAVTSLDLVFSSISDLTGIEAFTNLQFLRCESNQLTFLNVQNLTNLRYLYCNHNFLPALNVQGLTNLKYLYCDNNQLPTLNVQGLPNLQYLNCEYNQLTSLNVQGLTNLQTLYCNNNQLASINVQGLTNLQTLSCQGNQLPTLNVQGLTNLQTLYCFNNQLTSLFIKNGRDEEIIFTGNPNIAYICADEVQLTSIQNTLTGFGYTNCNINSYCSFTPGGTYYTMQGNKKIDFNTNGCDVLDAIYAHLKFTISNGTTTGSLISNATSNYSIPVPAGTHTITPQFENPTYFNASPASATVTFPATTSPFTQDFCIVPNGIHHDLEVVVIPLIPARPGFEATYKIKYKNKGVVAENGTINFNYNDAILDYASSGVAPITQSAGTLAWPIGSIAPFQSGEMMVTLHVNSPTATPAVHAGDYLSFTATINGLNTDETPDDNTFALAQVVVNSFDPNDKTCLEGNTISESMIGKYVHYMIRFENTGTFPAQNIVVKDMIDTAKFDISTLQLTDASHGCVTKIADTNKVEFIFENINLPFDNANNDGYVAFKIKTNSTMVLGDSFSNLANIYFDYNLPIVTNNYTTTIQNDLGINQFNINNLTLFPNPVKDILHFKTSEKIVKVEVYDITGRIISSNAVHENKVDVTALKTGNYILKVYTEIGITTTKIVKE